MTIRILFFVANSNSQNDPRNFFNRRRPRRDAHGAQLRRVDRLDLINGFGVKQDK